jgi:hypothetical protein
MKKNGTGWLTLFMVAASCANNNTANEIKDSNVANHHTVRNNETKCYADSVNSGLIPVDTMKSSPRCLAMGNINGKHVHIEYGSPGVKGRTIWDSLVPYDKVWVTGAHNATSITFSNDVLFGDKKITAGKYALFTIPGKEHWTVILNKRYEQHQADEYSEAEDVARITVQPEAGEPMVQRLSYTVSQTGEQQGKIIMRWERISITIPLRFN